MEAKNRVNKWKQKAISRGIALRALRKRLTELENSRLQWRTKYYSLKGQQQALGSKPAGHHYPLIFIWLCIHVYNCCQCSLRSCCEVIMGCALILQLKCSKPCAATIRNWIVKYGYYCYQQEPPPAGQWAIIIDESVAVGQQKLLLVLGLPLDSWKFTRPILHTDVTVLHMGIACCWKAAAISSILQPLSLKMHIAYCVSDKANNIMGAVKQMGWQHVYDCAHQWAKLLENLYGASADFKALMHQLSQLRNRWALSRYAHLMPPALRSKARFQNLFPLLDWIATIRLQDSKCTPEVRAALAFIPQQKALIEELLLLKRVIQQMGTILKVKGWNQQTKQQCYTLLLDCEQQQGRPGAFRTRLLSAWESYEQRLSDNQTLLCSSDIIESYFGRYKQKLQLHTMQAMTETVLTMAAWSKPITKQSVTDALTQVSMEDIDQWKKDNTTPSVLQKRKEFFAKNGTKEQLAF